MTTLGIFSEKHGMMKYTLMFALIDIKVTTKESLVSVNKTKPEI